MNYSVGQIANVRRSLKKKEKQVWSCKFRSVGTWKKIWSMSFPGSGEDKKISLPLRMTLKKRGMELDTKCVICQWGR